jgi:hypothetical protein
MNTLLYKGCAAGPSWSIRYTPKAGTYLELNVVSQRILPLPALAQVGEDALRDYVELEVP